MVNSQIFEIIRWYLYWPKFLLAIFCYCCDTLTAQLFRGVFHLDISFICWLRVIRLLCESSYLKKLVEQETSGQEVPQELMYTYSWRPFRTCPCGMSVSLMKLVSGKQQNFWSWDCSPQVLNYQDFWVIGLRSKGILLYIKICFITEVLNTH